MRHPLATAALVAGALLAVCVPAAPQKIVVVGLFKDRAVVVVDGKRRVLEVGEESPEGLTLVRADSEQAVIEIEGERRSYALGTHISSSFSAPPPQATVRVWPDAAGMYFVDGSIDGFSVRFLVDTGATLVAMNRNQARRLGIPYKLEGTEGLTTTASGTAKAYYVELDRVRVGDIELRDVQAAVIDGDHPQQVLLGNSVLNRLDMVRDGQVMELRKK